MLTDPPHSSSNAESDNKYWFGIDFGNSFIQVSTSTSEEQINRLGDYLDTSIVCMMETSMTRLELFGYRDGVEDDEFIDFKIVNIKRLIENLSVDENQMNEIRILESEEDMMRFTTQILTEEVKITSRDDVENFNKLALIRITDTITNSSLEISLFTVLQKLFEKLKSLIWKRDESVALFTCNIISTPVFDNDIQNNFVRAAFQEAGFKVERFIRETVAAARAYSFESKTDRDFLFLDCGATKTNLFLYNVDEGIYELLDVISDSNISGNAIDEALTSYCALEFKKKTKMQIDNQKAQNRLTRACRLAKEKSNFDSTTLNVSVHVDALMDGVDFSIILSRPKFEQIITPTLSNIAILLNSILERNCKTIHSINDLILSGASCQISKFASVIIEFFKSNQQFQVHNSISPKTVKVRGVTSLCELFRVPQIFCSLSILPLSIAIEHERKMFILAQRNTILPIQKSFIIEKRVDPSTNQFHFKLYMGERAIVTNNLYLGELCIPNSGTDVKTLKQFKLDVVISENEIFSLSILDNLHEYHFQEAWPQLTPRIVAQNVELGDLDKSS